MQFYEFRATYIGTELQRYHYDNILKLLMVLSTGIIFGVETFKKAKNNLHVTILSLIILVGFYISTLSIFNSI